MVCQFSKHFKWSHSIFEFNWVHNMICYLLIHPKFRFWKVAPESNSITFFREGSTNNYVRNEAAAGGNGKINVVESIPREKRKQVFSECSHFIVLPSDFEIPLMHRAHLGGTLPNLHRKIGLLQYYDFNGINAYLKYTVHTVTKVLLTSIRGLLEKSTFIPFKLH